MSTVDKAGSGSGMERRRLVRQSVIGRELITVEIPPDNFGLIIDLTENGVAIQAVAPLFRGTVKTLRCTLPPDPEPFELTAEVVWSRQNKEAGLRFINPSDKARARIRESLVLLAKDETSAEHQLDAGEPDQFNFDEFPWEADDGSPDAEPPVAFGLQLESLARRAMDATSASGIAVALLEDGHLVCRASLGCAPDVGVVLERNAGLSAEAIRIGAVVHCSDTSSDSRVDPDVCRQLGMASAVIIPVKRDGTVIALLESFWSSTFAYDDAGVEELCRIADCLLLLLDSNSGDHEIDRSWSQSMPSVAGPSQFQTSAEQQGVTAPTSAEMAMAVGDQTAEYDVAVADWPPEQELPVESEDEISSPVARDEPVNVQLFTDSLILPSSSRQTFTTVLIGIAAFVLFTIPLTWYLLQKDAVPVSAPDARSNIGGPRSETDKQELDSVELPSLSSVTAPGNGGFMQGNSGKDARTRPVVVTTRTVRPRKSGDFQPLRLIREPRMPASAIRVTGSSSRSGFSPRSAQAPPPAEVDSGGEAQRRGTIVLDVTVSKDGTVEDVRVVSGDPQLAEAAKETVSHWRYQPATVDGIPVQGNARVTVRFQATDKNQ